MELTDYILKLWQKIGYSPADSDLTAAIDDDLDNNDLADNQQSGGIFTPLKPASDPEKYSGVRIKPFPKETDHGDIMEFLIASGLDEKHKECVQIKSNGSVTITNLTSAESVALISSIHHKTQFGKKLFCNGIIPLTPDKPEASPSLPVPITAPSAVSAPAHVPAPHPTLPTVPANNSLLNPAATQPIITFQDSSSTSGTKVSANSSTTNGSLSSSPIQSLLDIGVSSVLSELDSNLKMQLENENLVRRYSLSLRDVPDHEPKHFES